ncbi:WD40 repeat-like protein, partial [Aureobasidium melanogenum]
MRDSLSDRLLRRELQDSAGRSRKVRSLYGDKNWVRELDIVNELDGHSGCVNALSWSKTGRFLASGSDDQHVNIHSYQPDDSNSQFKLATTIATGHRANIFSVKFMPQSNDRTVISAAGDSEVRIFDLEYSGATTEASRASAMASNGSSRGMRGNVQDGVRRLSDGDTNCRVYRSHGDRVKRIVTESSPHLFLTCSEDGEVRQWDLRQPSSAYPSPSSRSTSAVSVPPPLISYKRYDLDLNTISCSPSQPHYIALGGAHLHCFLHDRRMLGRDKLDERAASPALSAAHLSDLDEDALGQATRCVRKFAPRGQRV